jgi:monoamine oxidase
MPSSGFLRKGLEMAYVTEYGLEADEQTAINFLYLFYINPGNNSFDIFGLSDERYKVAGGNERIIHSLFDALEKNIVLGAELTSISKNNANVYTLNFKGISSIEADIVVMTLPFSVLRNVDLSKLNLPLWKQNAITNLGYGTNAKLIMGFHERTWRNYGHSGYIFTNGSALFPAAYIQTGWDSSQLQPTANGSYTVYQGGRLGAELSLSQADTYLNQLDSLWPGTAAQFNGISKLIHWPSSPLSLGSYSCWRVGQVTTIKGAEYAPVGNMFFAGEHTSSVNQGYMEGGAETGMMVAKNIAVKVY